MLGSETVNGAYAYDYTIEQKGYMVRVRVRAGLGLGLGLGLGP